MKKENPAIKYGIIGAVILIALGVIMQLIVVQTLKKAAADPDNFSITSSMLMGFLALCLIAATMIYCIVKAMKEYRKFNPDYTYRKLALQGLGVTIIMVLISAVISYIYNMYIMPENRELTIEYTRVIYENLNVPEEQKQEMLEKLDNSNPVSEVIKSTGMMLIVGMIISLISAMILNRRNALYNPNQMR